MHGWYKLYYRVFAMVFNTFFKINWIFPFSSTFISRHGPWDSTDTCQILEAETRICADDEKRYHVTCQQPYCLRDVDESCVNLKDQKPIKCRAGLDCCFEDAYHQFCHGCVGSKCSNRTCGTESSVNTFKRTPPIRMLPNAVQSEITSQRKQQLKNVQKPLAILYILERLSKSIDQDEHQSSFIHLS